MRFCRRWGPCPLNPNPKCSVGAAAAGSIPATRGRVQVRHRPRKAERRGCAHIYCVVTVPVSAATWPCMRNLLYPFKSPSWEGISCDRFRPVLTAESDY